MTEALRFFIKRYAGDRQRCNCGDAWYKNCGEGIDETGKRRHDLPACEYGCEYNQRRAAEEIIAAALGELLAINPSIDAEFKKFQADEAERRQPYIDAMKSQCDGFYEAYMESLMRRHT